MPINQILLQSRKMPFVRLLIALSAGIVLQWYLSILPIVSVLVFLVAFSAFLSISFLSPAAKFRHRWLQGVFVLLLMMAAGSLLCFIKNPLHQADNYSGMYKKGDAFVATINENLLNKPATYKANATVNGLYRNKTYHSAGGTIIVYFDKNDVDTSLAFGTQIVFTKTPEAIANLNNPGAFDYSRFLLFQGITAQVYLKSNEYQILSVDKGSPVKTAILQLQTYILNTIRKFIPNQKEQGVAEALLIGFRNDLDKQLVQSYSNTGVVHIIAISGLHLGMIYGFILLLFLPARNKKWYRFAMPLTALFVLWTFTLLAGAVPSILRSAVTFTFIAIGVLINRKSSVYNTLAASAFCLLLVNPFYLWDVGFQLSYMAVLGITMFTRPLQNQLFIENKFLNKVWLATCVTLAAQVFTLPVVLHNFRQFPVLFLITNLLVVALSEVILFALLFLVVVGKLTSLAALTGKGIQAMLWLMNSIIEYTEKIPFSLQKDIKIDVVQAWLLYVLIILFILWIVSKMPGFFVFILMVFVVIMAYTVVDVWQKGHQEKLVVYSVRKHNAIDVITGNKALCLYDDSLLKDMSSVGFTISPAHTFYRISNCKYSALPDTTNLSFRVKDKTIFLLSQPVGKARLQEKIKADIVIITGNPKLYMNDVLTNISCQTVVADNKISLYKLTKWKEICDSAHVHFHSVARDGAFVADL